MTTTRRTRPGRRGPLGVLGGVLALLLVLSGCVSIPRDGAVGSIDIGEDESGVQSRIDPDGPAAGAGPDEIVRGFLAAGAGYTNNFEVARSFLTDSFAADWDPNEVVRILPGGTGFDEITSEITSDSQNVSLTVPVSAAVDERRIYREAVEDTDLELEFALRQVNGEWRISEAPAGLVLSQTNFSTLFQPYPLFFYTPGYDYLVPDIRWFIRSPTTASEAMEELLTGPAEHLTGSVVTAVPEGARLDPKAVAVADGTAEVGLSETAEGLEDSALGRLEVQIEQTLQQIGSITEVRLSTPSGGVEADEPVEVGSTVQIDARPVVISDGRLARVSGTMVEPVEGSPELGDEASDPAVAIDESMYTYLDADGTELHRVLVDGMADASILTGEDLVGPSFDRHGWTWTAEADSDGTLLAVSRDGGLVDVDASFLEGRRILSLHASRDGSRIGVLSADSRDRSRLEIIGITRDSSGAPTGVASASPLPVGAGTESIADFSWAGSGQVVMLAAGGSGGLQPYSAMTSGPMESLGSIDGGSRISAGNDLRSVRVSTDSGELFTYGAGSWQKLVGDEAFDPAYPG